MDTPQPDLSEATRASSVDITPLTHDPDTGRPLHRNEYARMAAKHWDLALRAEALHAANPYRASVLRLAERHMAYAAEYERRS